MRILRTTVVVIGGVLALSARVSADGKAIYETRCAFCHGVEGRGDGPAAAALKPPATDFTAPTYGKTPLDRIKDAIAQGRQGTAMIAFGRTLKPEEIDAVARYILELAPH